MKSFWTGALATIAVVSVTANALLYMRYSTSRPLVTVGGEKISKKDYQDALEAQSGRAVLNKLVYTKLVFQSAAKAGVMPTDQDVDARIADIRRRNPRALAAADQDSVRMAQFKQDLTAQIALENLRIRGVTAGDQETAQFYAAHMSDFALPRQVQTTVVVTENALDMDTAVHLLAQDIPADVIARQPRMSVVGKNGYTINIEALPAEVQKNIKSAVVVMKAGQIKTFHIGKWYMTFKADRSARAGVLPLAAVKAQVERLVKLQKAPNDALELATLYQQTTPKFNIEKYAAFFDDVRQLDTHQTDKSHKTASIL